jgi:CheY-like chemotaxis protein
MLRRLGATTHEASNGKEALESVMIRVQGGERSFHCILMDCQVHLSLQPVEAINGLHGNPILAIVELQLSVCKCNEGLMCEA